MDEMKHIAIQVIAVQALRRVWIHPISHWCAYLLNLLRTVKLIVWEDQMNSLVKGSILALQKNYASYVRTQAAVCHRPNCATVKKIVLLVTMKNFVSTIDSTVTRISSIIGLT